MTGVGRPGWNHCFASPRHVLVVLRYCGVEVIFCAVLAAVTLYHCLLSLLYSTMFIPCVVTGYMEVYHCIAFWALQYHFVIALL
ncbi:hypothetical protein FKM82_029342 [Ascaphus truei]